MRPLLAAALLLAAPVRAQLAPEWSAAITAAPAPRFSKPAPPPAAPETVLARLAFSDLDEAAAPAFLPRSADGLSAAAAFDADGNFWLRLRQDGRELSFSEQQLKAGATAALPRGAYAVSLQDGVVSAARSGDSDGRLASFKELSGLLYERAVRFDAGPVRYAVLHDGLLASFCLLRRDDEGNFWVTHGRADAPKPTWFVSVNGLGFAFRLEPSGAVFFSKVLDAPPARAKQAR